jgi:hypothetical protein
MRPGEICPGGCGRPGERRPGESMKAFRARKTCGEEPCVSVAREAAKANARAEVIKDPAWPTTWPTDMRFEDHPGAR